MIKTRIGDMMSPAVKRSVKPEDEQALDDWRDSWINRSIAQVLCSTGKIVLLRSIFVGELLFFVLLNGKSPYFGVPKSDQFHPILV
jgi:hypothetical protein